MQGNKFREVKCKEPSGRKKVDKWKSMMLSPP